MSMSLAQKDRSAREPITMPDHLCDDTWRFCAIVWNIVHRELLVLSTCQQYFPIAHYTLTELDVVQTRGVSDRVQ